MIYRNRSALWGNHLFLEEINNEFPLGERPPCRDDANVNFLGRKPVLSESQKKEQPVAQHPCLGAEMPFITLTGGTVQKGTRRGWGYDSTHITALPAGIHSAHWEGKVTTHSDPQQLCVTVRKWQGPVGLTHAHQHITNWQPCPKISWMQLRYPYLKRRHLLWIYFL